MSIVSNWWQDAEDFDLESDAPLDPEPVICGGCGFSCAVDFATAFVEPPPSLDWKWLCQRCTRRANEALAEGRAA